MSQQILDPVLHLSVSPLAQLQRVAVEILVTISRSGFTHPIKVWPTLLAVTACPDSGLVEKAFASAAVLHTKHASLLGSKHLEPAKFMHDYLHALRPDEPVEGYVLEPGGAPVSRFARWYGLVQKDKRQAGLDLLKALARVFEVDAGAQCSEEDLGLARFVAEAMSTVEFRKSEEVMLVVALLVRGLAVGGLQVLHLLEGKEHGWLWGLGGEGGEGGSRAGTASPSKARDGQRVVGDKEEDGAGDGAGDRAADKDDRSTMMTRKFYSNGFVSVGLVAACS